MDLIKFQFSGFFRVWVLAIFRDQVFFGFRFGKIAKTHRVFEFASLQKSSMWVLAFSRQYNRFRETPCVNQSFGTCMIDIDTFEYVILRYVHC